MQKIFLLATTLLLCFPTIAQKSSKTKAADKLYERGSPTQTIWIRNANFVNTEHLEFSPVFYQNGIVYVTSRQENGPIDEKLGERFFELYYAESDRNGMPMNPEPFSVELNSQKHEGPVSFSRDMNRIYFTRNNLEKGYTKANSEKKVGLKIYEAKRGYFDWEDVRELPFNSDEYSSMHPALSADGLELYFSSNMPGGFGGIDLWVVRKEGDSWSAPRNLGPKINTSGNEGFPFVHESGDLYIASNGHEGAGGFDIFRVTLMGDTTVRNIGSPFNSEKDDLGFILNADGTQGYFASDREGGFGMDDIYTFYAPKGILGETAPEEVAASLEVTDEEGNPMEGVDIRILEQTEDGFLAGDDLYDVELVPNPDNPDELVMKLIRRKSSEMGGEPLLTDQDGRLFTEITQGKKYMVLASKEGFETAEILISAEDLAEDAPAFRINMKKLACINLNGFVVEEGTEEPVADAVLTIINQCDETANLLRTDDDGEFVFCLPPGCRFSVTAEKTGYQTGLLELDTETTPPGTELIKEIVLTPFGEDALSGPVEEGDVIVLENIYYDFGKSSIRAGAARELDALATLMAKYPSMEIEFIAHTDCRGSSEFNLDLSLRRAESAKQYLLNKGVASDRVTAFGYGEAQPRNECVDGVDCTEEEHAFNRRSEVRITRIDRPVKVEYRVKKP